MSDAMNMHALAGSAGKFTAFSLEDGKAFDNAAYPSQAACISALGWNRDRYAVTKIAPDGMVPKAAQAFLDFCRQRHSAGFRYADPDQAIQPDITMPLLRKDRARHIRHITK